MYWPTFQKKGFRGCLNMAKMYLHGKCAAPLSHPRGPACCSITKRAAPACQQLYDFKSGNMNGSALHWSTITHGYASLVGVGWSYTNSDQMSFKSSLARRSRSVPHRGLLLPQHSGTDLFSQVSLLHFFRYIKSVELSYSLERPKPLEIILPEHLPSSTCLHSLYNPIRNTFSWLRPSLSFR